MSHPNVKLNIALKLVIFSVYNSTGNESKGDDFFFFHSIGHWITIMLERFSTLAHTLVFHSLE